MTASAHRPEPITGQTSATVSTSPQSTAPAIGNLPSRSVRLESDPNTQVTGTNASPNAQRSGCQAFDVMQA